MILKAERWKDKKSGIHGRDIEFFLNEQVDPYPIGLALGSWHSFTGPEILSYAV